MPSHIHFQSIGATDQARAVAFYTEKLGKQSRIFELVTEL